jgi:hypothetical protein
MSMHLNLGNVVLIRVYNVDETAVYTSVQFPNIVTAWNETGWINCLR